jgi:hypothetical protein
MAAGGYFSQLKAEIEQLRARNGGRPVVLVSFSLGGPVAHVFFQRVTQAWKDANIKSWLSTSGTFGGVQESLMQQIGYNGSFTVSTMSQASSVGMMQSWGSQNWMASILAPNDVRSQATIPTLETRELFRGLFVVPGRHQRHWFSVQGAGEGRGAAL